MKKIYKILTLVILIFIVSSPVVYAVNDEAMSKYEIMAKYYELKDENQKLKDKYNDLDQKSSDKIIDIKNKALNIENSLTKIKIIGIGFSVLAPMGITIYVKKHIKDKIEELAKTKIDIMIEKEMVNKIDKKISKQVEKEKGLVEKMILDRKTEKILMETKKILAISKNNDDEEEIKKLLKKFIGLEPVMLGEQCNVEMYDVILFNHINAEIEKKEMETIINNNSNKNAVYFYFNKTGGQFKTKETENINFASSNATICGNLLDLMKYQEDILCSKD
ncbi:NARF domain-containing protein [Clostridium sp. VAP23]|uniref:NARF domain-containing protein n=1 Tax=Clostridium sp. VAP23 TaxID=2949981 RepID=UPI0020796DE3|nr:NARF domain-containing protein [Clostridium sp. VAP23]